MSGPSSSSQSDTKSTSTSTQQTATGTVGQVAQVAAGATLNNQTTDFGAINAAAAAGQKAIEANAAGLTATLANNAQTTANLFNFVGSTEQGAADLISKAIGLAAASSGQNQQIVHDLSSAPPLPSSVVSSLTQIDINKLTPWIVGGVVAYFVFLKGRK